MNQEKNHWLALYLAGKYPGHFFTPDKLLFIDELQAISPKVFSDDRIKMFGMFGEINEYEFYFSFINKVERDFADKFYQFLEKLNIPKEIKDLSIKKYFDHSLLLQEYKKVKEITKTTVKGKAFEVFLKIFFDSMDGLEVLDIQRHASDEQIDLAIKNNINRPFWINLSSPILIGEAKNWNGNTKTEVFNTLRGKIGGHKNFSRLGFVIALNEFTKEVEKNLMRDGSSDLIIVPISGADIETLLKEEINPIDWLEERITSAFR